MKKYFFGTKIKRKNGGVFILQLTDRRLKIVKCLFAGSRPEVLDIACIEMPGGQGEKEISEAFRKSLLALRYKDAPVLISLPRNLATMRLMKVPSLIPEEIEKIVSLQASSLLPYPAEELISGYEVFSSDKDGYSQINLIILHRDVIKRYLSLLSGFGPKSIEIILSSYGLYNLYSRFTQVGSTYPVMIVDADAEQTELAVASAGSLFFSRSFKAIFAQQERWQENLVNEIESTKRAFLKEFPAEKINEIVFTGLAGAASAPAALQERLGLRVSFLDYLQKYGCAEQLGEKISSCGLSFASLFGLGLKKIKTELNLLPFDLKRRMKNNLRRREYLRLFLIFLAAIAVFFLGLIKNFDNKEKYLRRLKSELAKVSEDARPLEEIDKRLKFMGARLKKTHSALDLLSELYKAAPAGLNLASFNYKEGKEVTLRGQAGELDLIFSFLSRLEKSDAFKVYNLKIRYATEKGSSGPQAVDFEIICTKKK